MSKTSLTKISVASGVLGLLSVIGYFLVETDTLEIRNDDAAAIFCLYVGVLCFVTSLFTLSRKVYLYGGKLIEKIIIGLIVLLLVFAMLILLVIFSLNINML